MKKMWRIRVCAMLLLIGSYYTPLSAVLLTGTSTSASVTLSDGDTIGDYTINTSINSTVNVAISGAGAPSVISGDATAVGGATLTFRTVSASDIINVNITESTEFRGWNNAGTRVPMIIQVDGPGRVLFNVTQGTFLNFGDLNGNAPVYVVVRGRDAVTRAEIRQIGSASPEIAFARVNPFSFFGYAASNDATNPLASLYLDNTRSDGDPLVFAIEDNLISSGHAGSCLVKMLNLNTTNASFLFTDLNFGSESNAGASGSATFGSMNTNPGGSFTSDTSFCAVQNRNTRAQRFEADPFEEGIPLVSNLPQPGFIVGKTGSIDVQSGSTFFYAGMSANVFPPNITNNIAHLIALDGRDDADIIKTRNYSAMVIDGSSDMYPVSPTRRAQINIGDTAAFLLASGAGSENSDVADGFDAVGTDPISFTPTRSAYGQLGHGNTVLSFEASGHILGHSSKRSLMQIVSREIDFTGFPLSAISSTDPNLNVGTIFPDFSSDAESRPYGKGCYFVNKYVDLENVSLKVADTVHSSNILQPQCSEPQFLAGDNWIINQSDILRPAFLFKNSDILIQRDRKAGETGRDGAFLSTNLDFAFPNISSALNRCNIYYTSEGSTTKDTLFVLGPNASGLNNAFEDEKLGTKNDVDFNPATDPIAPFSRNYRKAIIKQHALFQSIPASETIDLHLNTIGSSNYKHLFINLENGSTWDIGPSEVINDINTTVPVSPVPSNFRLLDGYATLLTHTLSPNMCNSLGDIYPNQSSFCSATTSMKCNIDNRENLILLSDYGRFSVASSAKVKIGVPVLEDKSATNAPQFNEIDHRVQFINKAGLSKRNIDVDTPANSALVSSSEAKGTLIYDSQTGASGHELASILDEASFNGANLDASLINNMPKIEGVVDNLNIHVRNTAVPLEITGSNAFVRNAYVTKEDNQVAHIFTYLKDGALFGLGNSDSSSGDAISIFGERGIRLAGTGNVALLLNGQNYTFEGTHQFGSFAADVSTPVDITIVGSSSGKEKAHIKVPEKSVFDLTHLQANSSVILENVELTFEAGSTLAIPESVSLIVGNNATIAISPAGDTNGTTAVDISSKLIRWIGEGQVVLQKGSSMEVPEGSYLGIVTAGTVDSSFNNVTTPSGDPIADINLNTAMIQNQNTTNFILRIEDDAQLNLKGGAIQVGNIEDNPGNGSNAQVSFDLVLNGTNAKILVDERSFLGNFVGIVYKAANIAPENWIVAPLNNPGRFGIRLIKGILTTTNIQPVFDSITAADSKACVMAFRNLTEDNAFYEVNFGNGGLQETIGNEPVQDLVSIVGNVLLYSISETSAPSALGSTALLLASDSSYEQSASALTTTASSSVVDFLSSSNTHHNVA